MCMQRDRDDSGDIVFPFPVFEIVDLTEVIQEHAFEIEVNTMNDIQNEQWNPYNLLPSSDEDEPTVINNDNDVHNPEPNSTADSLNETSQHTNMPITPRRQRHISFEINDTEEFRGFELNIPQIILSMSRISNVLMDQAHLPRN